MFIDLLTVKLNFFFSVIVKNRNIYDEPKYIQTESNTMEFDMTPTNTNGVLSPCQEIIKPKIGNGNLTSTILLTNSIDNKLLPLCYEVVEEPNNDNENSTSSEFKKNTKKRIRKRTHKKNKKNIEPVENVIYLIYNITYFCTRLIKI